MGLYELHIQGIAALLGPDAALEKRVALQMGLSSLELVVSSKMRITGARWQLSGAVLPTACTFKVVEQQGIRSKWLGLSAWSPHEACHGR